MRTEKRIGEALLYKMQIDDLSAFCAPSADTMSLLFLVLEIRVI